MKTTNKTTSSKKTFVNQKLEFVEELVLHTDAHIFLTGKAGTGKTTFLKSLPEKTHKRMVVVAPTGVAAINAGGQTVHSFFQLSFGPQLSEGAQLPSGRMREPQPTQRFTRTKLKIMRTLDLLVIDEISMVRADVLDAIDAVLRRIRRSSKPFGGVQLLMIGDVHQLAPVARPEDWELLAPYYRTTYFFGSRVLQKTDYLCVELDHIYRQHDTGFITLLNKVRDNKMDDECLQLLNSRYQPGFQPTEGYITLTTHNYQADNINTARLAELKGERLLFKAETTGNFPQSMYPTKEELELKIGAQVMFVRNDPNPEKAYYNGKIGQLSGYDRESGEVEVTCDSGIIRVPKVKWPNLEYTLNEETQQIEEKEIGSFTQIPLRLAWAVTIHKSQGLTFDKLVVDAQQAFAHGQVYVALSRCTSLEGLVLKTRLNPSTLVGDGVVDYFVEQMPEKEPSQEKVDTLRKAYELETILELIDFQEIYRASGRLAKVVTEHRSLFDGEMLQNVVRLRDGVKKELVDVQLRFESQVRQLHEEGLHEANPTLQERLRKGTTYFREHLKPLADELSKLAYKTSNKAVNERLEEALQQLREECFVKLGCLEGCEKGFSTEAYRKTKATKLLEAAGSDQDAPAKAEKQGRFTKRPKGETYQITKRMLDQGMTVEEIAVEREMAVSTIYGHIARLVEEGDFATSDFVAPDKCAVIEEYFRDAEDSTLSAARDVLGDDYEFWELRIVLAGMQR
jgi:hypothetical protein